MGAIQLRPYQQEAIDAIFTQWEGENRRTLLVLPTGCGKTTFINSQSFSQYIIIYLSNKFGFFIIRGTEAGVSYNRFTKHPEPQHRNEHWDSKFGKGQDPVIFKYHSF